MDSITLKNVFSVRRLMKEVIEEEGNREILQTNFLPMDFLLHLINTVLQDQQAPEVLNVWLQLLHNCLTQAKNMLHRSNSRQRCLDCLSNNPGRPSKQIKNWRLHFNYLFERLKGECSVFARGREAVIAPVIAPIIPLMKDVIEEEEERHTLQTELRPLDNLLLAMSVVFQDQHQAAPETIKIWLQLLHNCLTEAKSMLQLYAPSQRQAPEALNVWLQLLHNCVTQAKNMLHRSNSRQRCLDCLSNNPGRLSKQIKNWRLHFNYIFQRLEGEYSVFANSAFVRAREAVIAPVIAPIIPLMKDVIEEEEERHILQTELRPLNNLLLAMGVVFQDQHQAAPETLKICLLLLHNCLTEAKSMLQLYAPSQRQAPEVLNVWLQLLHNCVTQGKNMLHRSNSRPRSLDCLSSNPGRPSKQIKNWRLRFNYLFERLEGKYSVFVRGREAVIAPVIAPIIPLMKDVIEEEEERHTLQTELRPLDNLLLDMSVVFQDQHQAAPETLKIWLQLLYNCLTEAKSMLQLYAPSQRQRRRLDCHIGNGGRSHQEINKWKVFFSFIFQGLQEDFSMFVTSTSHYTTKGDPISIETEESTLSKDEARMLFKKVAFKDNRVHADIEEFATNIADECKGFLLATILVAAAMRGKDRVEEWETSLSSIKNTNFSSPDTLPPELYKALRWSYDALPNSEVRKCFLYCAMYPKDEDINVQQLVQMWVAEGLVRSKQKSHLTDVAIGRSYLNLLVDRCFFQNATSDGDSIVGWAVSDVPCIRVHHAVREMAIHIGEEEENCLFKAGQQLQNFPTNSSEDCKRISVRNSDIENLPTEFSCPKLVSLMLSFQPSDGFLGRLTSLKVLHLQSSRGINLIPSSVGQLKQLEFLSLRGLQGIRDLPGEIGQLSSLQFLDLQGCTGLESLPSEIGDLKNLKYLSLNYCSNLEMIPHEIFQLTSLRTLDAINVSLSVEAEPENIWRLKGLRKLTMLRTWVEGRTSSGIEEGIMGTWLDMRHLHLGFGTVMADLPQDMKKMRKLQLIELNKSHVSSLPNYICKFQHLECILLARCHQLRELSPLERLPTLKALYLYQCSGLKELGIRNSGGFCILDKLVLENLWNLESIGETLFVPEGSENLESTGGTLLVPEGSENLESIGGISYNVVWNESTLPRLRTLAIYGCPKLKRLPGGIDKSPNLSTIFGEEDWWQEIVWEDDAIKVHLTELFKRWEGSRW